MRSLRQAPCARAMLQIWMARAVEPPSFLPPADSMHSARESHEPLDAAATSGLGFEPWTAELIPADKRYSWKGVFALIFVPRVSLPHPNKQPGTIGFVHNSFTHLRLGKRIFPTFLFFENFSQCFQRQIEP